MKKLKEKIKYWTRTILDFCLNPRFLLCFGIAWIFTNGWAYISLTIAIWLKINWLAAVAGGYLAAIWIPFTPEKIITVIIAIFLLKWFFPHDKKTLEKLYEMKEKIKSTGKKLKDKHDAKKDLRNK